MSWKISQNSQKNICTRVYNYVPVMQIMSALFLIIYTNLHQPHTLKKWIQNSVIHFEAIKNSDIHVLRVSEVSKVSDYHLLSTFKHKGFSLSLSMVYLLCILLDHVDTLHLPLCCNQLKSCYMIFKNVENVELAGYWLRVCHFLCHFVCHFFFTLYKYFVIFVSCLLLVIS